jgi:hypothetical protein
MPKTEKHEPMRAKLLKDMDEPRCKKSSTDMVEPRRAKLLRESADPRKA